MAAELTIVSNDGVRHTGSLFFPEGRPERVFLCLPAMGAAADYYRPFAEAIAARGLGAAMLLDLRGQGRSSARARRGDDFGYREILELDLPQAVAAIRRAFPGVPLVLVGHSLGGQLGVLFAARMPQDLQGLVLVAAGTTYYRAWPILKRYAVLAYLSALRLCAIVLPWYPGEWLGFGGDQPRRLMRDWGAVVSGGHYRPAGSSFQYEAAVRRVETPVLSIGVREDPVAPAGAREDLLGRLHSAAVVRMEIDGVLAHRPWKRHFSWARAPEQAVDAIAVWLRSTLS